MKTIQNPRSRGVFFGLLKYMVLPFFAALSMFACSDADQIGLELIESPASLNATDTLTLQAYTLLDDSVATSISRMKVLGIIDDPVFGKTRSGIYSEIRMEGNEISLGENPQLDSIYLVLTYQGSHYGALGTPQTVFVYELSENFPEQDTLFSNQSVPFYPELITKNPEGFKLYPAPTDSVMIESVMRAPQIRIPLSQVYGQKFIDANGTEAFENVPNFLEVFKGFYVKVDDYLPDGPTDGGEYKGKGSMFQIDMLHPFTAVELFYHNEEDTLMMRFPINEFAKHFSETEHFGYDDAHEALRAQVVEQDLSVGDSLLFVQSLGQVRTDIQFPFLEELEDKPWIINKAELIVPVQADLVSPLFPPPAQMLLLRHKEEGGLTFVSDYALGVEYFGGQYDAANSYYRFNITQYFQQMLDGTYPNLGLAMMPSRSHDRPGRVVFHGPGRSEEPMKLVLFYSVFE